MAKVFHNSSNASSSEGLWLNSVLLDKTDRVKRRSYERYIVRIFSLAAPIVCKAIGVWQACKGRQTMKFAASRDVNPIVIS